MAPCPPSPHLTATVGAHRCLGTGSLTLGCSAQWWEAEGEEGGRCRVGRWKVRERGESAGVGERGEGSGDSRLLHTSLTPYTHTPCALGLGHSPEDRPMAPRTPFLPPPPAPSHSSWKVELQELSICPPAYPSHCLEAASSMQPPGPLVSLPGCESRSRRGTMSSDTSALPPPQVDGKCKGQHRGSCSCMYMFVCPRVHMYVHVCMHK